MDKEPKKYELPEDTKQMVSEPATVAYTVPQQHSATYYTINQVKPAANADESMETIEIPNTYEEAMGMDLMDLEDAKQELLSYVDELAKEFHLS